MKVIPGITIWKDKEALSLAAAYFFVAECHRCIAAKGQFVVALSGGNTPRQLYQLLADPVFSKNIPWSKVYFFWSDERFVAHTHPESNYKMVKEALLDGIRIPRKNIFAVPVNGDPLDCAKRYETTIRSFFGGKPPCFDWLLLGIGEDGHTASLFPGTELVQEKKKCVGAVWVEEKNTWRISFTFPLINNSSSAIFLVAGREKSAIVSRVMRKKGKLLPAQMVDPVRGRVYWMLDEAAAKF